MKYEKKIWRKAQKSMKKWNDDEEEVEEHEKKTSKMRKSVEKNTI